MDERAARAAGHGGAETPTRWRARLDRATAELDPPFAVVDLDAFDANLADLLRRADGVPIRLATKSVRSVPLIHRAVRGGGVRGLMAYSLREALWLHWYGLRDIVVAYPTADRGALQMLAGSDAAQSVTLMVDSTAQLRFIQRTLGRRHRRLNVCIDVDASLKVLGAHLGVRRSPVRTAAQARALATEIGKTSALRLVGLMFYEAQIAGLPDAPLPVRLVKKASASELADRRSEVVRAVRREADLRFVNGGGTGSLEVTTADPTVTEVTAGSGLFGPSLFDSYRSFRPRPAALYAVPVVRHPARKVVTVFGGGYPASGTADRHRLPKPTLPRGLRLLGTEGAGEVQTPLRGGAAARLRVGDRVWMRHAKAGELCERFDELHLVRGDRIEDVAKTYRGEGQNFG